MDIAFAFMLQISPNFVIVSHILLLFPRALKIWKTGYIFLVYYLQQKFLSEYSPEVIQQNIPQNYCKFSKQKAQAPRKVL